MAAMGGSLWKAKERMITVCDQLKESSRKAVGDAGCSTTALIKRRDAKGKDDWLWHPADSVTLKAESDLDWIEVSQVGKVTRVMRHTRVSLRKPKLCRAEKQRHLHLNRLSAGCSFVFSESLIT